jgi:hypothetical protein
MSDNNEFSHVCVCVQVCVHVCACVHLSLSLALCVRAYRDWCISSGVWWQTKALPF